MTIQLSFTDDELAFRTEVRSFLANYLPEEFKRAQRCLTRSTHDAGLTRAWLALLWEHGKGWAAPLWPREFGGAGFSPVERFIFEAECARADAPVIPPQGVRYVGPLLIRYGSKWQQDYFLPRLQSGEHYWAQGYSEPEAGSDLAALQTRAVRDGSDYVVNGCKIWTTDAHIADWIFALVRTSLEGRKQDGISLLLIDMRSAGISVRPIITLAGEHETNQVFFDDVRVPAKNLVGEEGKGWAYGKFILTFERGGSFAAPRIRRMLELTEQGAVPASANLLRRIATLHIEIDALQTMELRLAAAGGQNNRLTRAGPSIVKLTASRLRQAVTRLGVDALGARALQWSPPGALSAGAEPELSLEALSIVPRYLDYRAWTIFAGTSEMQREIIAKETLSG